jgi:predicted dehydrogenase
MRVAVVGAGSAGARHVRHLIGLGHQAVTFDPCITLDGVEPATSVESALAGADAAIIASPSAFHIEHALAAISAHVPVLVEKPLATTHADGMRLAVAATRADTLIAVAMNLRFLPALLHLRSLVRSGELGTPLLCNASFGYDLRRWRPHADYRRSYSARSELGGGILLDAIHELDYLLWLFGPAAGVRATCDRLSALEVDVEDVVVACVRFESGVLAALDLNFFEPAYRRGCTIVGSDAVASWDWRHSTVTVSCGDESQVHDVPGDVDRTYLLEVEDFLDAVAYGRSPSTSVAEGCAALALADAIRAAAHVPMTVPAAGR